MPKVRRSDDNRVGRHSRLHGVLDAAPSGRVAEIGEIGAGRPVRLGGELGNQGVTVHSIG